MKSCKQPKRAQQLFYLSGGVLLSQQKQLYNVFCGSGVSFLQRGKIPPSPVDPMGRYLGSNMFGSQQQETNIFFLSCLNCCMKPIRCLSI